MARDTDRGRGSDDVPGGADLPPAGAGRKPRRRRWLRVLGVLVVLILIGLIVLAGVLPSVLSSKFGTRQVIAAVNDKIRGRVDVQAVDLSWRGPSTLDGLKVLDPQHRQVLTVNRVKIHNSLWQLVRSPMTFGQVDIEQPQVVLYQQKDQPPSLAQAFEPRQPSPEKPAAREKPVVMEKPGPTPAPKGQLAIHGGTVRMVKPDGQELGLGQIDGKLALDTLNDIQSQLGAQLASGGQMQAEVNVKNLAAGGTIDTNQATGQFVVRTDEPVKIAPLAAFADRPGVTGLVNLDLHGQIDRGAVQADLRTQVNDFSTRAAGSQAQPQPIDLLLTGQVQGKAREQINAHIESDGRGRHRQRQVRIRPRQSARWRRGGGGNRAACGAERAEPPGPPADG